jgi:hypothetical protein
MNPEQNNPQNLNNKPPEPPQPPPSPPEQPAVIRPTVAPSTRFQPENANPTTPDNLNPAPLRQEVNPPQPPDTSRLFQPDSPGSNPFNPGSNSAKRKKILIGLAPALIALIVGGGWVFGFYLPNKPQNVWRTGLDRTGSTLDKLVIDATEKDKLEQSKKTEVSGSLEIKGEGANFSGSFSSKYDPANSDSGLNIKYDDAGSKEVNFNAQLKTKLPDDTNLPDLYFKVTGLNTFGVDQLVPTIAGYDGKWISVSSEYLKSVLPPETQEEFKKDRENDVKAEDVAELARIVSGTTHEYVFTSDESKSVLVQKRYLGVEKLDNDITAYHYEVGFNKSNVKEYCKALVSRFMGAEAFKKLPGVKADNIDKDKEAAIKDCEESADKDIKDNYTFDMWVDKKYKLVHKLRFSDEQDKGTYFEVGQTYRGDDVLPLFLVVHSDKDQYNAIFDLEVDTVKTAGKGTFDFAYTGAQKYTAKASFEFKPYEGDINVEEPKGAIPIEEVLKKLGLDPSAGF